MASVPLPKKTNGVAEGSANGITKRPQVWAISSTTLAAAAVAGASSPLGSKCGKHQGGRRGVCCKELKKEERHLIDPDVMRDM
jgi:hypothetical protein